MTRAPRSAKTTPTAKTTPSAKIVRLTGPRVPAPADRGTAIYAALRRAIIEQALKPGAKLPEDAIGANFGVSRTIVRTALRQLAAEGLVEIRRNRGASVARPSWEEAGDIFAIRLALERLVVERLAGRLGPDQVARLKEHAAREDGARGVNEPQSVRLATEFHVLLAEMTGSEVLARYVGEVVWRCGLTLTLYSRPHSSECGVNEHREIIAALEAGDAARAVAVMDAHLSGVVARALIAPSPKTTDLSDILRRYTEE
ncbi:GntR family transcriptional regulator [Methylobacterium isbiliense]|jgi:DNA-binding GntR family transcriptional regulator|uniref:HTH-type transcriptional repressor NanR n=1 Tax=Methylobacterium isbiliense TaxID=315478 RepID=A0ABQ4SDB2_9HYPH|nr:GntR family transcriptional regulator [Methylobacterium isbiliense]MDN3623542.1 GntR family transcriptional regulator [Methylobacterium isbiliense]GJD99794.1 HTH-type transcriptional repressor NanR [Methylobacterium isbiliense]